GSSFIVGNQHVDGQAARRGSRRGRKAEIYGRIDVGRRVCPVVDALPDPSTVAVQCICVTSRGHQRKECACTDQCRQQRCGSHMISPINVNGTPVASNWSRTFFEQTSFKAALFAPAVPEIQKALEGLKGRSRCVLAALPLAISR